MMRWYSLSIHQPQPPCLLYVNEKNLKTTLDSNPLAFVKGAAELSVTQPF